MVICTHQSSRDHRTVRRCRKADAPVEKFSGRKSEGRALQHGCYLQDLQQSLTPAALLHWTVTCNLVQKWTLDVAAAQRYGLCV